MCARPQGRRCVYPEPQLSGQRTRPLHPQNPCRRRRAGVGGLRRRRVRRRRIGDGARRAREHAAEPVHDRRCAGACPRRTAARVSSAARDCPRVILRTPLCWVRSLMLRWRPYHCCSAFSTTAGGLTSRRWLCERSTTFESTRYVWRRQHVRRTTRGCRRMRLECTA